ncbi:hypothetical protein [Stappia indica]|uniref:hypothetical protein n=1 Tax=Stappia indica TaxID=538381 RepID=UPI001CD3F6E3|nr:hypothetical protein [Stappia indica]MCA1296942.1 hypothetical protein [Stappia indica]
MIFGDPHEGQQSDLGWSVDWRFDQLMQKLRRFDLMIFAQMVAQQQFGDPSLENLTENQKQVLIDGCRKAIVEASLQENDSA